jgi:hypothetical protein
MEAAVIQGNVRVGLGSGGQEVEQNFQETTSADREPWTQPPLCPSTSQHPSF